MAQQEAAAPMPPPVQKAVRKSRAEEQAAFMRANNMREGRKSSKSSADSANTMQHVELGIYQYTSYLPRLSTGPVLPRTHPG